MVRITRTAAVAALALAAAIAGAPAAQAAPAPAAATIIDVSCVSPNSTDVLKFTPPLQLAPAIPTTVDKTTNYQPCRSQTSPNVISGFLHTIGTLAADACPMVLNPGTVSQTITWNTGATSTLSMSRTATLSGTTLTVNFIGTVTAGLFAGSNAKQTYVASTPDLAACLAGTGAVVPVIKSAVTLTIYH
jgi:hypothetical protein